LNRLNRLLDDYARLHEAQILTFGQLTLFTTLLSADNRVTRRCHDNVQMITLDGDGVGNGGQH